MREWVNELTGRVDRASTGIRVPAEAEITQLMSIFPDVQRDVIVAALQRR
jgi:CUE domain